MKEYRLRLNLEDARKIKKILESNLVGISFEEELVSGDNCSILTFKDIDIDEDDIEFIELVSEKKLEEVSEIEHRFVPKDGQSYFYYEPGPPASKIKDTTWHGTPYDKSRFMSQNVFRTLKEAQFGLRKFAAMNAVSRYAERDSYAWNYSIPEKVEDPSYNKHYMIQLDTEDGRLKIVPQYVTKTLGAVYFETLEDAKKCIEEVGASNIKKYLLGSDGIVNITCSE